MSIWGSMTDTRRPPDPRPLAKIDAEIRKELEFHLEMRAADNEAAGMPPRAAREDALRRFGDRPRIERSCRTIWAGERVMLQRLQTALTLVLLAIVVYLMIAQQRAQRAGEAALAKMAETIERVAVDSHALVSGARPVVVETIPHAGDCDVSPVLREIRVVFSKPMAEGCSWARRAMETFPHTVTVHGVCGCSDGAGARRR